MLKLRSLKFCLFALLTVLLCLTASPSLAGFPTTAPSIQSTQNPATRAERLEQQGRSHYTAGQFTEARVAFEQAAQAYAAQGNPLKQAIALSNLSLTDQQLGQWTAATQAITESLRLLDIKPDGNVQRQALAQVLDIQGRLYLLQGNGQAAFETWEQAATLYQQLGDQAQITENQINQAQALQTLGLYRRAIQILAAALGWQPQTITDLDALNAQLQTLAASPTAIAALQSLGEALRVTGNLKSSRQILQQSLAMAQRLQQPEAVATAQFKLGNVTWTEALINLSHSNLTVAEAAALIKQAQQGDRRVDTEQAEKFDTATLQVLQLYRQAAATSLTIQLPAQLNQLRVLIETERRVDANQLLPSVQQLVSSLPIGHGAIEARINLAQSLVKLNSKGASEEQLTPPLPSPEEIAQLLTVTIQQAKELQDPRAESYALGYLGELYEKTGQLQEAQQMTRQALRLAKGHNASDIAYRWQWQLGRLLKAEADIAGNSKTYTEAIAAYTEATKTLQSIRSDLIAITAEEQLSFRDAIEPVYRELITLLLQSQSHTPDTQNLITAREVIESLQLAELNNFFREACLEGNPALIDQVDQSAAVFYPIILPDQLAVIVSLPQQSSSSDSHQTRLEYYTMPVSQKELETTVNLLRDSLDQANDYRFLPPAKQLYDWLIRPMQDQLEANQVNTLVFVLDGVLRNIPMSVLHDGQQYLVEKPYSVAVTPGLQLLGTQPLAQKQLRSALLAGITIARPGFSALPSVKNELAQIQAEIPNTTTLLDRGASPSNRELTVDRAFTNANFQTAIAAGAFPIVHLATHGRFSSQLEETYILTEDGRLNIEDLRSSLKTTAVRQDGVLELLVLSACETAKGDNQAALGLAGIAIQAGARSTVATLWQVNDYSSAIFMGEFYRELVNVRALQTTKAKALQQAQRSLLQNPDSDYKHPYFWAPYVLIGNWR
jgi:CHAT domain-containing protein/tetratricopeptide (TPR) repeat protein